MNPTAKPPLSRPRRDGDACDIFDSVHRRLPHDFARRAFDRLADAHIGAATADIPGHRGIDIGIVRLWRRGEQRRGRHDLAGLAIAALNDFEIEPGLLHFGAGFRRADAFDRQGLYVPLFSEHGGDRGRGVGLTARTEVAVFRKLDGDLPQ